ncbi:NAD(P)-dependent dehydrogenase, short-chain alcohol dehydrogenase family [Sphingobium faniae]|nr:NAD(P)-dependent dehydrogenase, short-chain alcohol dehydrogenase family [Sphingobium faniae]
MSAPAASASRGRTAIVIGAGGGVGKVIARRLIAEGMRVIGTVSASDREAGLRDEIPRLERVATLDLADGESAARTVDHLCSEHGAVDVVIVAAAAHIAAPLENTALGRFRRIFEINCLSCLATYQAAIPYLRKTQGRLVFVSSVTGRVGSVMQGAYAATKFGLEGMADVMRQELLGSGVRIVLVEPGGIDTPMVRTALAQGRSDRDALSAYLRHHYDQLYEAFDRNVADALEGGRLTSPDSVAEVVVAAVNAPEPDARYVVGDDAKFLIDAADSMTTAQLDELLVSAFRNA